MHQEEHDKSGINKYMHHPPDKILTKDPRLQHHIEDKGGHETENFFAEKDVDKGFNKRKKPSGGCCLAGENGDCSGEPG